VKFKEHIYYFIGIGGIGMSSIARYLFLQGASVFGYDKTRSAVTNSLEELGVTIVYDAAVTALPTAVSSKESLVVYTPAVSEEHPQLNFFIKQGNKVVKRAKLLGDLTRDTICLAVAGTHGKTTTTAILTHLFEQSNASYTAFVGGIFQDSKTNMMSRGSMYTLVEADEFDRSFLHLSPTIACITSMDVDHLDVYSDAASLQDAYKEFASQVKGFLFVESNIPLKGIKYSVSEEADFYIDGIRPNASGSYFDLHTPDGIYKNQFFNQLGMHNLSNALVALAMASKAGLLVEDLAESLASFPGVERRLQVLINEKNRILIDDYAHHPTEIKAVYETLKLSFPADEKCVVFQPHLFSRTQDFMTDFATTLSLFDRVLLLDIYPARELPIEGVSSDALKELISGPSVELVTKKELANRLSSVDERIIVLLGAGDIGDEVEGIKHKLLYDEAL
tara:strand:+ start:220 stop:1566 length:1347 start_codon:yes stop_codon:yes gene_type:complete